VYTQNAHHFSLCYLLVFSTFSVTFAVWDRNYPLDEMAACCCALFCKQYVNDFRGLMLKSVENFKQGILVLDMSEVFSSGVLLCYYCGAHSLII